MRILLTTESFRPHVSGVTVAVESLADGLAGRGHEVLVLAPRPAGEAEPVGATPAGAGAVRIAGVPSYQLPIVAPPGYRMPWPLPWSAAAREALAFRPEVVHAHSPFVSGLLALRTARSSGAPLVFTHHTRFDDYGHYLGPLAGPGSWLADAYLRRFWAATSAVVAPSGDLAGEIGRRLGPARRTRIHVIPTGVDVTAIRRLPRRDPRADLGWPAESVVVVSLGRLAPEKSTATVLDAVAVGLRHGAPIRLLVIGGGPSEVALRRRAAEPDLAGHVAFTGSVPRTDALARLPGGDLFAFASLTETQGLVLAEALTAGLPAIALDGPGVRDSVRDGVDGVLVAADPPASRAERMGSALAALATDVDRRSALARRAAEDADRFSIERRLDELEALYASLR